MVQPLPAEASAPAAHEHLAASAFGSQPWATGKSCLRNLRAVACIDSHIFRGEIAGPYAGDSAAGVQIHDNWYIFRQHFAMSDAFVEGTFATSAADTDAR